MVFFLEVCGLALLRGETDPYDPPPTTCLASPFKFGRVESGVDVRV